MITLQVLRIGLKRKYVGIFIEPNSNEVLVGRNGVRSKYINIHSYIMTMESGIIMANESNSNTIGYINLHKKLTRKRTAVNPHGAFEVAGAGNEVTYTIAPVLDPTIAIYLL